MKQAVIDYKPAPTPLEDRARALLIGLLLVLAVLAGAFMAGEAGIRGSHTAISLVATIVAVSAAVATLYWPQVGVAAWIAAVPILSSYNLHVELVTLILAPAVYLGLRRVPDRGVRWLFALLLFFALDTFVGFSRSQGNLNVVWRANFAANVVPLLVMIGAYWSGRRWSGRRWMALALALVALYSIPIAAIEYKTNRRMYVALTLKPQNGEPLDAYTPGLNRIRAVAMMGSSPELGIVLVCIFGLALVECAAARRVLAKGFWLSLAAGCSVGVYTTQMRGSLLALPITMIILSVACKETRRLVLPLLTAAVLVVLAALPWIMHTPMYKYRLSGTDEVYSRMGMYGAAFSMWKEHPLDGVGLGNFTILSPAYRTDFMGVSARYSRFVTGAHNSYLRVLAEQGLVGITLFLLIVILQLALLVRRLRTDGLSHRERAEAAAGLAACVAFWWQCMSTDSQWTCPYGLAVMLLMVGWGLAPLRTAAVEAPVEAPATGKAGDGIKYFAAPSAR